jgi:hypothetical protein
MPSTQSAPRESQLLFGRMFREARLKARRSALETSRHLGCTGSYICHVEQGKRGLAFGQIGTAARLFETDPLPLLRLAVRARGEVAIKAADLPDKVIDLLVAWSYDLAVDVARPSK